MTNATVLPKVGDGATIVHYSDRTACTVVKVGPSGKVAWIQADKATLDKSAWNPSDHFSPGGFCGHFDGQYNQKYTYERNTDAPIVRITLCKDGRWRCKRELVFVGVRSQFYDYNF